LIFPFDNTDGAALRIAIASPFTTTTGRDSLSLKNQQGQTISEEPSVAVAPNGHSTFQLPVRSADPKDARGTARIDQSNGLAFGVALRSKQGSVTALDAVTRDLTSIKTIPHVADGGGWKTSITLVNCDAGPASFTLNFWSDGGDMQSGVTGTLADGGTQTIETSGAPAEAITVGRKC
jgi:hypothetical protein